MKPHTWGKPKRKRTDAARVRAKCSLNLFAVDPGRTPGLAFVQDGFLHVVEMPLDELELNFERSVLSDAGFVEVCFRPISACETAGRIVATAEKWCHKLYRGQSNQWRKTAGVPRGAKEAAWAGIDKLGAVFGLDCSVGEDGGQALLMLKALSIFLEAPITVKGAEL